MSAKEEANDSSMQNKKVIINFPTKFDELAHEQILKKVVNVQAKALQRQASST